MSNLTIVSGPAGVGKSTHLSQKVSALRESNRKVAICAPTGLAANQIGGVTIHSLFGISPFKYEASLSGQKREFLKSVDSIVIDEFSMIGKELFDLMSKMLKRVMANEKPFGGKEVLMYGDILQLPPINKNNDYFFESKEFDLNRCDVIYLRDIRRQSDNRFITLLNNLRIGHVSDDDMAYIDTFTSNQIDPELSLFPTRNDVHQLNEYRLSLISGEELRFPCVNVHGSPSAIQSLLRSVLPPELLKLKVNARVMITINDPSGKYFNGSQGTFLGVKGNALNIRLDGGVEIELNRRQFNNNNPYNPCVFDQYPLTLAYAMTIHKAQGMTMDRVNVDFTNEFGTPFMAYVALSRVRSPSNLMIKGFKRSFVKCDPKAITFDKALQCKHTNAVSA